MLDYLAKKSQQPEYSDDEIVSWMEPMVTEGSMQSNVEERGHTGFNHIVYDSLFTGVDENRQLTSLGRFELARAGLEDTADKIAQLGVRWKEDYISHARDSYYNIESNILNEAFDRGNRGQLTSDYLGDAKELFPGYVDGGSGDVSVEDQLESEDVRLAAIVQYATDLEANDEREYDSLLDGFIESYNTRYSDEQKARWRAMARRERKGYDDLVAMFKELKLRDLQTLGEAGALIGANAKGSRAIDRYLSECQADGKEASVDDFVEGYNAGKYRDPIPVTA